jgi:thiamine biosynthesis lipoprotein
MHPADSGLKSVTVVCTGEQAAGWEGLVSDGLSTACFILGEKASLPILSSLNAEAVMIREDGSIYVTDGLKDAWQETR